MSDRTGSLLGALLVADESPLAQELNVALARHGMLVESCTRADEAISLWESTPPAVAVVVLDDSPRARTELVKAMRGMPTGETLVVLGVGRVWPGEGLCSVLDDFIILPLRAGELDLRLEMAVHQVFSRLAAQAQGVSDRPETVSNEAEPARIGESLAELSRLVRQRLAHRLRAWVTACTARVQAPPPEAPPPTAETPPESLEAAPPSPALSVESVPESGEFRVSELANGGAPDGLWDWDLTSHTVTFSPQIQALRGFAAEEIVTTEEDFFQLVHPHDREALRQAVTIHLEQRSPHFESEHRIQLRDGGWGWMLSRGIAFRDAFGRAIRMVGSQAGLNRRTGIDPITGMYNRSYFLVRLARALEATHDGTTTLFAVLFFNLDRFKNVNYTLGHRVGDQLLAAVAGRLRDCLRELPPALAPHAVGAHMGADEFAILLEHLVAVADAVAMARSIQEKLRPAFVIEGQELFVTTCIGIATSERPYTRPEDLLRDADAAAHQARSQGRTTHSVFQPSMHDLAAHVLRLEVDLRHAVQRQEFRVYYQPIVLLSQGTIAGFEALVRWQHPSGRLIMPNDFIPLAEEIGLISDIDRWVLNEVCRQLRVWEKQFRRRPPLTVAVNFSGVEFQKPEITMEIDRALRTHGVWGRNLKIEITESVIMEHARYAADMLAHLRALDIRLSIDDFGTGYSSLSYLRRFEIDLLKIDRSFVGRMDTDQDSEEIVRTIVTLAKNLGKEVVAEGVERRRQLDQLIALGCMFGQGYLFSRPVDARTAASLLADEAAGHRLLV